MSLEELPFLHREMAAHRKRLQTLLEHRSDYASDKAFQRE